MSQGLNIDYPQSLSAYGENQAIQSQHGRFD